MEVSWIFFTLFLLYNDGKLGKSADSGANIIRISHGNVSIFSVHQLVSLCPPVGLFVPVIRHPLPVKRASVARKWGNECPYYGQ